MAATFEAICAHKRSVFLGAFGHGSLKPLTIVTTWDVPRSVWGSYKQARERLGELARGRRTPLFMLTPAKRTSKAYSRKGWYSGFHMNGTKQQSRSSAYPVDFGRAIANELFRQRNA